MSADHCSGFLSTSKEYFYNRIGLYYSSKQGYVNFCDVHTLGQHALPRTKESLKYNNLAPAWYSATGESVRQIKNFGRSRSDVNKYAYERSADSHLDIANGGDAVIMGGRNSSKMNTRGPDKKTLDTLPLHIWLFGPLLFDNYSYGSLFLLLRGSLKPGTGYQALDFRGSSYAEGEYKFPVDWNAMTRAGDDITVQHAKFDKAYDNFVNGTFPIPVPPGANRWLWKMEAHQQNQSKSKACRQRG